MYTVLFDLDGVLADCKPYAEKLLGRPIVTDEDFWSVANMPFFFSRLPLTSDAKQLWTSVLELKDSANITEIKILTATGHNYVNVSHQKRFWVHQKFRGYFNDLDIITVSKGSYKAAYAQPKHILIDDTPSVIHAWNEANGLSILHTDAESTITKLKNLLNIS